MIFKSTGPVGIDGDECLAIRQCIQYRVLLLIGPRATAAVKIENDRETLGLSPTGRYMN